MSDYGFRRYNVLRTRVLAASDHSEISSVAARITEFVQDEDHNPVYCETLVNMLMSKGYDLIGQHSFIDTVTHDIMAVRVIVRNVRTTVDVWRRTMETNASQAPEG